MQQALTSPAFRSIALGGLLLASTVAAVELNSTHTRRLVLHAETRPCTLYLTAWRHGDVEIEVKGNDLRPMTFQTRARVSDGCRWLATETLVPVGENRYAYSYDEEILGCRPGSVPYLKTPRTGYVDVIDLE